MLNMHHQLDKVQHRAARFVKRDYRRTTSVSELISQLRRQSLEEPTRRGMGQLKFEELLSPSSASTSTSKNAGKILVCPCSTRVYMDWQLSLCMNFSILQYAPDTVELIHVLLCHPTLMPTSIHFSQGQLQIGTLFLPPPEPSSLLVPSRKPSTSSQTLLLTVAEPYHSSNIG